MGHTERGREAALPGAEGQQSHGEVMLPSIYASLTFVLYSKKHPDLDTGNHHNNFALLFMSTAFKLEQHISPICLPEPRTKPYNTQLCVAHGWGKDKFGSPGEYQTVLKEVVTPTVANGICERNLR